MNEEAGQEGAKHLMEGEEWEVSVSQCCTLLFQVFSEQP